MTLFYCLPLLLICKGCLTYLVCHTVGANMDILFNAAKSTLFRVWKFCDNTIDNLLIGNARIRWCK